MRIHDSEILRSIDTTSTPCIPSIPDPVHIPSSAAPTTSSSTIITTEIASDAPDLSCSHCSRSFTSHIGLVVDVQCSQAYENASLADNFRRQNESGDVAVEYKAGSVGKYELGGASPLGRQRRQERIPASVAAQFRERLERSLQIIERFMKVLQSRHAVARERLAERWGPKRHPPAGERQREARLRVLGALVERIKAIIRTARSASAAAKKRAVEASKGSSVLDDVELNTTEWLALRKQSRQLLEAAERTGDAFRRIDFDDNRDDENGDEDDGRLEGEKELEQEVAALQSRVKKMKKLLDKTRRWAIWREAVANDRD
ncbi:hypothetical protein SprV_0702310700 [Sparganum proliferum]